MLCASSARLRFALAKETWGLLRTSTRPRAVAGTEPSLIYYFPRVRRKMAVALCLEPPLARSLLHRDLDSAACQRQPVGGCRHGATPHYHRACAEQWWGSMQQAPACGVARTKRFGFCCAPAPALGQLQGRSFPTFSPRAQGKWQMQYASSARLRVALAKGTWALLRTSTRPRAAAGTELPRIFPRVRRKKGSCSMHRAPACAVALAWRPGFCCVPAPALGRLQARSSPTFTTARAQGNRGALCNKPLPAGLLAQRGLGSAAPQQPP